MVNNSLFQIIFLRTHKSKHLQKKSNFPYWFFWHSILSFPLSGKDMMFCEHSKSTNRIHIALETSKEQQILSIHIYTLSNKSEYPLKTKVVQFNAIVPLLKRYCRYLFLWVSEKVTSWILLVTYLALSSVWMELGNRLECYIISNFPSLHLDNMLAFLKTMSVTILPWGMWSLVSLHKKHNTVDNTELKS